MIPASTLVLIVPIRAPLWLSPLSWHGPGWKAMQGKGAWVEENGGFGNWHTFWNPAFQQFWILRNYWHRSINPSHPFSNMGYNESPYRNCFLRQRVIIKLKHMIEGKVWHQRVTLCINPSGCSFPNHKQSIHLDTWLRHKSYHSLIYSDYLKSQSGVRYITILTIQTIGSFNSCSQLHI